MPISVPSQLVVGISVDIQRSDGTYDDNRNNNLTNRIIDSNSYSSHNNRI